MQKLIQTCIQTLGDHIETLFIVMLIGKRTCGKGTLASILCHLLAPYGQYVIVPVSAVVDGHIKKFEADPQHDLGRRLVEQIDIRKAGGLMSDEPIIETTFGEIIEFAQVADSGKLTLFLDGFARTVGQGDALFKTFPNIRGYYSDITDDEVFRRAAQRTTERAAIGLPQRPDDMPVALRKHLNGWPQTYAAICSIQKEHPDSLVHFKGTLPIREQIKICLAHLGFTETEIIKIMRPLDTNPDHEATKIVWKLEGRSHPDRKSMAKQAMLVRAPHEPKWINFAGPVADQRTQVGA